jgi:hypothetical protein
VEMEAGSVRSVVAAEGASAGVVWGSTALVKLVCCCVGDWDLENYIVVNASGDAGAMVSALVTNIVVRVGSVRGIVVGHVRGSVVSVSGSVTGRVVSISGKVTRNVVGRGSVKGSVRVVGKRVWLSERVVGSECGLVT